MMLDAHAFGMAERLRNHNGYLDSLIEMVPAKYYFPPDPDEMVKKLQKHVNKPATQTAADKLQRKMESSERKRAKLDPEQLTVPQQQQHNAEQEEQERVRDRLQQRRRSQQEGDSDGDEDEDEAPGPVSAALSGYNTGDVSTVSELKARLQQKLEKLRNGRGGAPKSSEEREREREEAKAEKKKRKLNGKAISGGGGGSGAGAAAAAAPAASSSAQPAEPGVGTVFNRVAAPKAEPWKAKRKLSDAQLLAHAEEAAGKMRQRKAEGKSEELGIEVWQKALEKAGGVKQKDDPSLLKKAMKRKERQKKKSAKEWKARLSTTAKSQADKQKSRTENLAARGTKGKSKANKRKEIVKKRAGFEGAAKPLN